MTLELPAAAGSHLVASTWGTGAPVLLLHAGGERRRVWDPIGPYLAAGGRYVVAVDQRGHGESPPADMSTLDGFVDDLGCVLVHLGPMALVGASLGGVAALGAAARWPELVTAIALIDALPNVDAEVVEDYLAPILAARADAPSALVQNIVDRVDELGAWASSFVGPLLLVRGENSPLGPDLADRLGVACPHLTVATIEGAGHLVARDQPTRLAQVLDDFL